MPISQPNGQNQKDKGTLISQTFKVPEIKINYFLIFRHLAEIRPFPHHHKLKSKIWPYLSHMAENQKNKGTLLSSTLKIQEINVLSDF